MQGYGKAIVLLFCVAMTVGATRGHAQAFVGPPFLTPVHPTPNHTIIVNIEGDGCEELNASPVLPVLTQDGNALRIVYTGVFYTDPLFCVFGAGIQSNPLASFPAGSYTLDIIWRYPGVGGDFETQDLGTLPFTVGQAVPPPIANTPIPALGIFASLTLLSLLVGISGRKFQMDVRCL